ncbi:MAG: ribonuclease III [Defluviitaleaceae bacterium]|nr:ribonuclease III [Defluviitaleaceae bacterium]
MPSITPDLGYTFRNAALLQQALTHKSYAFEHNLKSSATNERLEFLGDAVLELCISQWLYDRFPTLSEGKLTQRRAALVCEASLAAIARGLFLGKAMRLGNGEETSGGRDKPSLLSDALEAILGAIFLDGGIDAVRPLVERLFSPYLTQPAASADYKTTLQEILQKNSRETAVYEIIDTTGPSHQRLFVARVNHQGKALATGEGASKKEAEQNAAKTALEKNCNVFT